MLGEVRRTAPHEWIVMSTTSLAQSSSSSPFVLTAIGFALTTSISNADLNQMPVRTIEWLTDNSNVIYVTRVEPDSRLAAGKLLRVMKGDHRTITQPLTFSDFDGYHYYAQSQRARFAYGLSVGRANCCTRSTSFVRKSPTTFRICIGSFLASTNTGI